MKKPAGREPAGSRTYRVRVGIGVRPYPPRFASNSWRCAASPAATPLSVCRKSRGSRQPVGGELRREAFDRTPAKTGISKKVRLHERVNAIRQRRRRLPMRDRLRHRRRLVELRLKVKK